MIRQAIVMLSLACAPPALADADCHDPARLQWLVGAWRAESGGRLFEERWSKGADGALDGVGTSRKADEAEASFQEALRIERRDGSLQYVATVPANPAPVAFTAVRCSGDGVVFENPQHDRPQRIAYTRTGQDTFTARVTDLEDKGFQLDYRRAD